MSQTTVKYARIPTVIVALSLVFLVLGTVALLPPQNTEGREKPFQIAVDKAGFHWLDVIVTSQPGLYDTVDKPVSNGINFPFHVRGQCPEDNYRLKSAAITVGPSTRNLEVNHEHRSIGADHGLGWEGYEVFMRYTDPDLSYHFMWEAHSPYKPRDETPGEACNAELERLLKTQGTRASWLEKGFVFRVHRAYKAGFTVWCEDSRKVGYGPDRRYYDEVDVDLTLRCRPNEYRPPRTAVEPKRTAVPDPPISDVAVAAEPRLTKGRQCPLYVNFRGKITADEQSPYATLNTEYRFVGDGGYQTEWTRVSVNRGESRSINGRRFIEAPKMDPSRTFNTPGVKPKIPLFNGWMLVEVKQPYLAGIKVKQSAKTEFTVDCNPQPAGETLKSRQ